MIAVLLAFSCTCEGSLMLRLHSVAPKSYSVHITRSPGEHPTRYLVISSLSASFGFRFCGATATAAIRGDVWVWGFLSGWCLDMPCGKLHQSGIARIGNDGPQLWIISWSAQTFRAISICSSGSPHNCTWTHKMFDIFWNCSNTSPVLAWIRTCNWWILISDTVTNASNYSTFILCSIHN